MTPYLFFSCATHGLSVPLRWLRFVTLTLMQAGSDAGDGDNAHWWVRSMEKKRKKKRRNEQKERLSRSGSRVEAGGERRGWENEALSSCKRAAGTVRAVVIIKPEEENCRFSDNEKALKVPVHKSNLFCSACLFLVYVAWTIHHLTHMWDKICSALASYSANTFLTESRCLRSKIKCKSSHSTVLFFCRKHARHY